MENEEIQKSLDHEFESTILNKNGAVNKEETRKAELTYNEELLLEATEGIFHNIDNIRTKHLTPPVFSFETDEGRCLGTIETVRANILKGHQPSAFMTVTQTKGRFNGQSYRGQRTIEIDCDKAYKINGHLHDYIWREQLSPEEKYMKEEKTRRLSEEERLWRYNYFLRVYYDNIPKRRSSIPDQNAYHTAQSLWNAGERIDKTMAQVLDEWMKDIRTRPDWNCSSYNRPKIIDGKFYALHFNRTTGFFESHEVASIHDVDEHVELEEILDVYDRTILHPAPTEKAYPSATIMEQAQMQRWLEKCPYWMESWKHKLVKLETWTILS